MPSLRSLISRVRCRCCPPCFAGRRLPPLKPVLKVIAIIGLLLEVCDLVYFDETCVSELTQTFIAPPRYTKRNTIGNEDEYIHTYNTYFVYIYRVYIHTYHTYIYIYIYYCRYKYQYIYYTYLCAYIVCIHTFIQ